MQVFKNKPVDLCHHDLSLLGAAQLNSWVRPVALLCVPVREGGVGRQRERVGGCGWQHVRARRRKEARAREVPGARGQAGRRALLHLLRCNGGMRAHGACKACGQLRRVCFHSRVSRNGLACTPARMPARMPVCVCLCACSEDACTNAACMPVCVHSRA